MIARCSILLLGLYACGGGPGMTLDGSAGDGSTPTDADMSDAGLPDAPAPDAADAPDAEPDATSCPGTLCGEGCVDTGTDPDHCGTCDHACPSPADGSAACEAGECTVVCDEGLVAREMECAPRLVPVSTDFDGDGLGDIAVAALGRVAVFYGRDLADPWTATQVIPPPRPNPNFGGAIATLGDTDGDGFGELAVMERGRGYVWVFRGGAGGLDTTTPIELPGCTTPSDTCDGESVAAAGDIDGDGLRDLLVVRSTVRDYRIYETAYLFRGAPGGLSTGSSWSAPDASARGAGDVDGDGFDDVLVWPDISRVRVVYGSATGLTARETPLLGTYGMRSVRALGDVNGDGFDDVGLLDATGPGGPRLLVYLGADGGIGGAAAAALPVPDSEPADFEPGSLAGVGDVDGDGFGDVALGVAEVTGGTPRPGHLLIWWGGASGISTEMPASVERPSRDAAPVSPAGDVDGDGLADVVAAQRGVGDVIVVGGLARGSALLDSDARTLTATVSGFGRALGDPL